MPCQDSPGFQPVRTGYETNYEADRLRKRNNKLARLLCGLVRKVFEEIEDAPDLINEVQGLTEWWEAHEQEDRERVERKRVEEERAAKRELEEAKTRLLKAKRRVNALRKPKRQPKNGDMLLVRVDKGEDEDINTLDRLYIGAAQMYYAGERPQTRGFMGNLRWHARERVWYDRTEFVVGKNGRWDELVENEDFEVVNDTPQDDDPYVLIRHGRPKKSTLDISKDGKTFTDGLTKGYYKVADLRWDAHHEAWKLPRSRHEENDE